MISFKDYATKHNISYEAVRKQVVKYEGELKEHIIVQNKVRYFDDFAESFLDEHRGGVGNTTIILHNEVKTQTEEIDSLKEKNRVLTELLAEAEHKLNLKYEEEKAWTEERASLKLLAVKASGLESKQEELLRTNGALDQECLQLKKDKEELEAEKAKLAEEKANLENELNKEKNSYVKSLFGLFRKVK